MAIQTKTIKNRIKSVANIKKITRAMEMVAASKMKKATDKALATRDYTLLGLEVLVNVAREREVDHFLMTKYSNAKKRIAIVITSNKGLCSSYNINVFKNLKQYVEDNKNADIKLITVGKYAERYARKVEKDILASFIDFSDNVEMKELNGLYKIIADEYAKGDYAGVDLIFTNYISAMSNRVLVHKLLPVAPENILELFDVVGPVNIKEKKNSKVDTKSMAKYIFEPSETKVVARILPVLTEIQLYQALLESQASEHSVRMMAMRNASESADEMADELTLTLNQARQAAITQEISEIVGGAQALGS